GYWCSCTARRSCTPAESVARDERVAQVRTAADPTLRAYAAYVPVGEAAAKLRRSREQDAEIHYPSSHRDPGDVAKEAAVLAKFAFSAGRIVARERGESYGDIAAREMPGVTDVRVVTCTERA